MHHQYPPTLRHSHRMLAGLLGVGLAACSAAARIDPVVAPQVDAQQVDAQAVEAVEPIRDTSRFLRFIEDESGRAQLQTNMLTYVDDKGRRVTLIGVVHIGDQSYYELLNERFKSYDVLLYEMVKPKNAVRVRDPEAEERRGGSLPMMLQNFMRDQLALTHQLDHIDYDADNFVHADLDYETFVARQAERGESMFSMMLNNFMREMSRDRTGEESDPMGMMELLEALQSPDRASTFKRMLGARFGQMDGDIAAMEGSVILDDRNKHAMKVLRQQLDAGKSNVAIFYGAAHLPGMEEILVDFMGFRPEGDPEWLTAWDIPAPAAVDEPQPGTEPDAAPERKPAPIERVPARRVIPV